MTYMQARRKAKKTAKRTGNSQTVWRSGEQYDVTPYGAGAPVEWRGMARPVVTIDPAGKEYA